MAAADTRDAMEFSVGLRSDGEPKNRFQEIWGTKISQIKLKCLPQITHPQYILICFNNNQQKVVHAFMKKPHIGSLIPGSNATFEFIPIYMYYLNTMAFFSMH